MVKFDRKRCVTQVLKDLVRNVREFPDIPLREVDTVFEAAKSSILAGGDVEWLTTHIMILQIEGLASDRVERIATSLWRKAEGRMCRMHLERLCIAQAVWRYSGVPCLPNPQMPSPQDLRIDELHRGADGTSYPISRGILINGRQRWPGEDWFCHCWDRWRLPVGLRIDRVSGTWKLPSAPSVSGLSAHHYCPAF